jgi:hypothetical protein
MSFKIRIQPIDYLEYKHFFLQTKFMIKYISCNIR